MYSGPGFPVPFAFRPLLFAPSAKGHFENAIALENSTRSDAFQINVPLPDIFDHARTAGRGLEIFQVLTVSVCSFLFSGEEALKRHIRYFLRGTFEIETKTAHPHAATMW